MAHELIDGGQLMHGRLTEDSIHGEAFEELKRIVLAWEPPRPPWPAGTTFTDARKERHWASLTAWAILPTGVRYELLVERAEYEPGMDPREVPPVLWSIMVEQNGTIYAYPRIANMKVTLDPPHSQERITEAYAGRPIGLEKRYLVGRLSRGLREDLRTVSEGWGWPS